MMPTFSVIVIAYKRKEYILSAINSILIQTYPKELIEIIVVKAFFDQEVDDFLEKEKITSIFKDNSSNGILIVEGINASRNNILCLLEDDDIFHPTKLTDIAQAFEKYPNVDFFLNGYTVIRSKAEELKFLQSIQKEESEPEVVKPSNMYKKQASYKFFFNNSRYSFRRKWVPELSKLLSGAPSIVDTLLTYFFIVNGSIGYDKKHLNGYRIHDKNLSIVNISNLSLSGLRKRVKKEITSIEFFFNYFKSNKHRVLDPLQLRLYNLKIESAYISRDKKSVILGNIFVAARFYVRTLRSRERNYYVSSKSATLKIAKSIFLFPLFVISPRKFSFFYYLSAPVVFKHILSLRSYQFT